MSLRIPEIFKNFSLQTFNIDFAAGGSITLPFSGPLSRDEENSKTLMVVDYQVISSVAVTIFRFEILTKEGFLIWSKNLEGGTGFQNLIPSVGVRVPNNFNVRFSFVPAALAVGEFYLNLKVED